MPLGEALRATEPLDGLSVLHLESHLEKVVRELRRDLGLSLPAATGAAISSPAWV